MILRVDNRERDLIVKLKEEGIEFEVLVLDLGDVQVLKEGSETPLFIIERKTLADLLSSIRDGRNREQKARLRSYRQQHGTRLLYIYEGIMKGKRNRLTAATLLSCCINTPLRDGIPVHRTHNLDGTVAYLLKVMKNIAKWDAGWDSFMTVNGGTDEKTVVQYAATLKSKKKSNMTPALCFMRQLASIPGVSAKIAHEIREVYSSMRVLITAYQETAEEDREGMLSEIKINGRRLGTVKSTRICQYMCV